MNDDRFFQDVFGTFLGLFKKMWWLALLFVALWVATIGTGVYCLLLIIKALLS